MRAPIRLGQLVLAVLLALGASLYITKPLSDPDLGWHIVVGRWILANRSLPVADHWNMFAVGNPWIAYSWSSEVLFAALDRALGIHGLLLLQIGIGALFALTAIFVFSTLSGSFGFGALFGTFLTASCFNHFTLRPQLFTWIFFLLLVLSVWKIEKEGGSFARSLAVVGIMAAWANTHITTVFGVGTIFLWLLPGRGLKGASGYAALAFAATLATPYFGAEWLTFFSKTSHPFSHHGISEFNSSSILQTTAGLLFIELALLLLLLHHRPKSIDPAKLLLLFGFVVGGAAVVKFLPFSLMMVTVMLALLWGRESEPERSFGNLGESIFKLASVIERHAIVLTIPIVAIAILKFYLLWKRPLDLARTGTQAFEFAARRGLPEPYLVPFDFGGHLMYRISDEKGVLRYLAPIDGRTNVVPVEVWNEFIAAYRGQSGWDRYLKRVNPGTIIWRTESPFISLLLTSGEWCELYRAGEGVNQTSVLSRRGELNCPPLEG